MPIGVATILTTLTLAGSLHGAYSHVWPRGAERSRGQPRLVTADPQDALRFPMNAATRGAQSGGDFEVGYAR